MGSASASNRALSSWAVLPPRSIAAFAPSLDRAVLRAVLSAGGPWARSSEALASRLSELLERSPARWVAEPEDALLAALADRVEGPLVLALPAYGHPGFEAGRLRPDTRLLWMEPAVGRTDPGPSEIAAALDQGANAVVLTPIAGDLQALPEAEQLCARRGAVLALDARNSMGARALERGPQNYADLCLVPADGEGGPSPCPGAVLLGDEGSSDPRTGPRAPGWAIEVLARAIRDEPHLRRLLPLPGERSPRGHAPSLPPAWAIAAAAARAESAAHRGSQRARHARSLQMHCSHIAALDSVPAKQGFQAAGLAFPVLASGREGILRELRDTGVEAVTGLAGWLAPDAARGERSRALAERLILLPLHPYYRPQDLDWLAERLRQATLRVNGTGDADPSEAVHYAAKAAGEL